MGRVYIEQWQAIKLYLLTKLQAEAVPGGALAGIAVVETVAPPESTTSPALGFQFRQNTQQPRAQNREDIVCIFEFSLVVERDFTARETDAAASTGEVAEKWWNDMAGHGLGAVLNALPLDLDGLATYWTLEHAIVIGRGVLAENETSAVVNARMVIQAQVDAS